MLACAAALLPACSPTEDAPEPGPAAPAAATRDKFDRSQFSEVLVTMRWDESMFTVHRTIDGREFANDDDLASAIKAAHDEWVKKGKPDAPVTIAADARVPWNQIMDVVNLIKRCDIEKIEFALGPPVQKTPPK